MIQEIKKARASNYDRYLYINFNSVDDTSLYFDRSSKKTYEKNQKKKKYLI